MALAMGLCCTELMAQRESNTSGTSKLLHRGKYRVYPEKFKIIGSTDTQVGTDESYNYTGEIVIYEDKIAFRGLEYEFQQTFNDGGRMVRSYSFGNKLRSLMRFNGYKGPVVYPIIYVTDNYDLRIGEFHYSSIDATDKEEPEVFVFLSEKIE